jgi:hypothetical protein
MDTACFERFPTSFMEGKSLINYVCPASTVLLCTVVDWLANIIAFCSEEQHTIVSGNVKAELLRRRHLYEHFAAFSEADDATEDRWRSYVERVGVPDQWEIAGGHEVLKAVANLENVRIVIIKAVNLPEDYQTIEPNDCPARVIKTITLVHYGEAHYDSTLPINGTL